MIAVLRVQLCADPGFQLYGPFNALSYIIDSIFAVIRF